MEDRIKRDKAFIGAIIKGVGGALVKAPTPFIIAPINALSRLTLSSIIYIVVVLT